jgi:hypothetical protein
MKPYLWHSSAQDFLVLFFVDFLGAVERFQGRLYFIYNPLLQVKLFEVLKKDKLNVYFILLKSTEKDKLNI